MLLRVLRYFFGYVKVEVYGFAPERFMNLLIHNDIIIWNVLNLEKGYTFFVGRKNLTYLKPLLQKTNMKLKILEKHGFPYFVKKNKKRSFFVFGFVACGIILYILSLFVWEVKVVGENHLVAENILKRIETNYVKLGTKKSSVDCSELEERIRKDFDEISWVSCELKGTDLTVYLEEGIAPRQSNQNLAQGDIVAIKDAVITKMITRKGTPVVKVKDSVKKGDVLISGTVYIYDDNNEVLESNHIAADGDVYGITTAKYEDYLELQYYQKKYADKSKNYYTLFFGNYCLTPYQPKMHSKDYDTCVEVHKARILNHFYLPFGYKSVKRTCYTLEAKEYTPKEAKQILNKRLTKKINTFKEKGVEIIKNDVTIKEENGKMIAKGTFELKEAIANFKKNALKEADKDKEN